MRRSSRSSTSSPMRSAPRTPRSRRTSRGLQQQVKDQGLWAIFLDEELGGPGFGQLKLALLNEIIGRYPSAPQMFGAAAPDTGQHGDARRLRHRGAEAAVAQAAHEPGDVLGLLDDRAPGRVRPEPVQDPRRPRRRRVGHQRREVVHLRRPSRRHPLRHVHERHVRRAPQDAWRGDPARAPQPQPHHLQRRARPPRPPARSRGRRQGARPAAARRRPDPPRHAHDRPVQARLRHDVRAGAVPRVARQDHRRAPDGAGEDRRLLRRAAACCG